MTEVSKTLAPAATGSIVVGRHDRWFRSTVTDWTKFSSIGIMFMLLLAVLIVRAPTFGNPVLHVDETFYFTVARGKKNGTESSMKRVGQSVEIACVSGQIKKKN